MLALAGNARIFLCRKSIDLRKGFEGLSSAVSSLFAEELTSGAYFVFINRRRDLMKILYWDSDGLAIWHKRLEKGCFSKRHTEKILLDRREFFMLLEGITPHRLQRRYKVN